MLPGDICTLGEALESPRTNVCRYELVPHRRCYHIHFIRIYLLLNYSFMEILKRYPHNHITAFTGPRYGAKIELMYPGDIHLFQTR